MWFESSEKCPEVRPKVRPLVCPSHVSRGYSDGRTIEPGDLIVTRVPPAAWVAKDARLLRRSVLGYLVCVAVFWLFKCCRYSHLNSPTMGASLHNAVPFRPSSQGLRSLATLADAPDRCRCWPSDRIVTTHRPSGCGPNKLLFPRDWRSHSLYHTTTRRACSLCSGTKRRARHGVDFYISLPQFAYGKRQLTQGLYQARESVPTSRHLSLCV